MCVAEIAAGFNTYTDTEEIRAEIARAERAAAEPTTTVLTTSLHC
jgi:hypothetical protein